jgi:hypothetical protein
MILPTEYFIRIINLQFFKFKLSMRKFLTLTIICFAITLSQAQQEKKNKDKKEDSEEVLVDYSDRVQTLDSTLETLYAVISGEKGEARNWKLFKYLFHPGAKLIPSGKNSEGNHIVSYLSPESYVKKSGPWLVKNGFFEKEIHRTINTFGNIAQVFSTYEAYKSHTDETPFMRGINSIQLLNDEDRWWIINIYWSQETETTPIPRVYLPKDKS